MISPDKLFGNFFNDGGITPVRLANFAHTTVANNTSLLAYLGAMADTHPNDKGVEVGAAHSRNFKLSELGDEANTFLLIKNMTDVNNAAYVLEVRG